MFAGNFQAGDPGAVLKKYDPREQKAFVSLMKDILRPYVPDYRGIVPRNTERILIIYLPFQRKRCSKACIFSFKEIMLKSFCNYIACIGYNLTQEANNITEYCKQQNKNKNCTSNSGGFIFDSHL